MSSTSPEIIIFIQTIIFLTIVFLQLAKKNSGAVWLYATQSAAVAALLFLSADRATALLPAIVGATILVKVIFAPTFFLRLIKKHQLTFSASTYLNAPLTLLSIGILLALAKILFTPLVLALAPDRPYPMILSLAGILISLLLLANRKGALSQMIGVLSLENNIVSFALLSGLEQSASLELGILFILCIWIVIATVFAAMMYKHFGSLDVSAMKELTE